METRTHRNKEITREWLSAAQSLSETDPSRAKELFGLSDRIQDALKNASSTRLNEIAESGLIYFTPRSETVLELALKGDSQWAQCALHMVSQRCR